MRHLGSQVGRNARGLLVVAPCQSDQGCVIGVGVEGFLERTQLVEQAARLVRAQQIVRDPSQRREVIGPMVGSGRRHHRLLVPTEHPADPVEIGDLAEPFLQLLQGLTHGRAPYRGGRASRRKRARAVRAAPRSQRPDRRRAAEAPEPPAGGPPRKNPHREAAASAPPSVPVAARAVRRALAVRARRESARPPRSTRMLCSRSLRCFSSPTVCAPRSMSTPSSDSSGPESWSASSRRCRYFSARLLAPLANRVQPRFAIRSSAALISRSS